jgi:hypothetical protein
MNRAHIVDELETTLPNWIKRASHATWFPAFVHVLKVWSRATWLHACIVCQHRYKLRMNPPCTRQNAPRSFIHR